MARRTKPGGKNPLGESRFDRQQRLRARDAWSTDPDAFRFDAKPSEAMPPVATRAPLVIENPRARINPKEQRFRILIFNNGTVVAIRYFDTREAISQFQQAWYKRWQQYLNKLTYPERSDMRTLQIHPWGMTGDQIQPSWQPITTYVLERILHPLGDFDWPFTNAQPWISIGIHFQELGALALKRRQEALGYATVMTRKFDLSEDHL